MSVWEALYMANNEEGAKKELHQKFSVISYNVQFLLKFLHSYNYSKTRVNKIAELVRNDDIILFQEAFMNKKQMSKQAQQPWSWSPVFKKSSLLRRLHEIFHSPALMA